MSLFAFQGISELPDYNKITFPENNPIPLEEIVPDASADALNLLKKFLVYPTKQRISAKEALLHLYFFTEPLPAHHSELPIPQRSKRGLPRRQQTHDYNIDVPLEKTLIDPELLAPHVVKIKWIRAVCLHRNVNILKIAFPYLNFMDRFGMEFRHRYIWRELQILDV